MLVAACCGFAKYLFHIIFFGIEKRDPKRTPGILRQRLVGQNYEIGNLVLNAGHQ
jgi:hypothetical protein